MSPTRHIIEYSDREFVETWAGSVEVLVFLGENTRVGGRYVRLSPEHAREIAKALLASADEFEARGAQ